ncbi:hypothetical protein HQ584_10215 [Patescibacteria group bacterium]|nr:hypothetical protein [Patescibacteria group bacterium]
MYLDDDGSIDFRLLDLNGEILFSNVIPVQCAERIKFIWDNLEYELYRLDQYGDWQLEIAEAVVSITEGSYAYSIIALDEAGNESNTTVGSIEVDLTLPVLSNIQASPEVFCPLRDFDGTSIVSSDCSEVASYTLNIYDQDDGIFWSHTQGSNPNFSFEWNGAGNYGEYKSDYYTFTYEIIAEDLAGNSTTSSRYEVTSNRCPSYVSYIHADPDPFSWRAHGETQFCYMLSYDNLMVSIFVMCGNEIAKTVQDEVLQDRGEYSVGWVGDYDEGFNGPIDEVNGRLYDQIWMYRISAYDPRGGSQANSSSTILLDSTPPYVVSRPVEVDNLTMTAIVEYNVPEKASVEVTVRDEDDNLVEVVFSDDVNGGDFVAEWTGNQVGVLYHFKIVAVDRSLNEAMRETESFSFN